MRGTVTLSHLSSKVLLSELMFSFISDIPLCCTIYEIFIYAVDTNSRLLALSIA